MADRIQKRGQEDGRDPVSSCPNFLLSLALSLLPSPPPSLPSLGESKDYT